MPDFKTYNPTDIKMSWNGVIFTGYAEGSFVVVERSEDSFSKMVGAGGDVVRVAINDKSGIVTIRLLQSSSVNNELSAKVIVDERLGSAAQVGPFFLKDLNGPSWVKAVDAWIQKPANYEAANTATAREWVIACAHIDIFDAGQTL